MFKRFGVLVFVGNIATVVALACGGAAAAPTATPAKAAAAATPTEAGRAPPPVATPTAAPTAAPTAVVSAKPSGSVVEVDGQNSWDAKQFDPGYWQGSAFLGGFRGLYRVVYEPLAFTDADGRLEQPILATSWSMAKDGLSWTFQLRKGVKFQNGEDFNAQVMVKNMQRAKGIGASFYQQNVTGYETPDPYTMTVKLKGPDLALISRLIYSTRIGYPAPAGYIDSVGPTGNVGNPPIGTGPYKFLKADTASLDLTLEAWDGWGGYWGFKPTVKTVRFLGVGEQTTRIAMLATGEADIAILTPGPQLREVRGATVHASGSVQGTWIEFFNQGDPSSPYGNVKVRQAINYAVDKQTMIDKLLGGAGEVMASTMTSVQFGFPKDLKPYPYDPAKAKQLLAEAGFASGFDGGAIFASTAEQSLQAQAIASYLSAVGIKVQVTPMDYGTLLGRWIPPKHNMNLEKGMGFLGSSLAGDGAYRIESFFTRYGDWGYTVDPQLDATYDKTLNTVDISERGKLLSDLATYTNSQAYKLFLWSPKAVYGWGPRIADWRRTPGEAAFDNAQSIRLK
ncbi:MAG: ABC transporter substrate-binding protein [Dehalococcoidia bacterium]|nr:ABC transporter substrate-binding protein [Dehalococcoidia bacterium]